MPENSTETRVGGSLQPDCSAPTCGLCGHSAPGEVKTIRAYEIYHQDWDTYTAERCVDIKACVERRQKAQNG